MAVRALLHYALEVPDQTVGEKFYRNFGLVDEAGSDDAVHLRPAPLKRAVRAALPGAKEAPAPPRLRRARRRVPGHGGVDPRAPACAEVDPPRGAPEGGLWLRDPDGNLLRSATRAAEAPPPDPPLRLNSPGHIGAPGRPRRPRRGDDGEPPPARPRAVLHAGRRSPARLLHARARPEALRPLRSRSSRSCAARPTITTSRS